MRLPLYCPLITSQSANAQRPPHQRLRSSRPVFTDRSPLPMAVLPDERLRDLQRKGVHGRAMGDIGGGRNHQTAIRKQRERNGATRRSGSMTQQPRRRPRSGAGEAADSRSLSVLSLGGLLQSAAAVPGAVLISGNRRPVSVRRTNVGACRARRPSHIFRIRRIGTQRKTLISGGYR